MKQFLGGNLTKKNWCFKPDFCVFDLKHAEHTKPYLDDDQGYSRNENNKIIEMWHKEKKGKKL